MPDPEEDIFEGPFPEGGLIPEEDIPEGPFPEADIPEGNPFPPSPDESENYGELPGTGVEEDEDKILDELEENDEFISGLLSGTLDEKKIRNILELDEFGFETPDEEEVKFGLFEKVHDPTKKINPPIWSEKVISESRFTVFVSDLHPSDSTVADDFYINHINEYFGFPHSISKAYILGAVLKKLQELFKNRYKEQFNGMELVLLGDCFDFLECASRKSKFLHTPLGLVLKKFNDDGNTIIHILGNHDPTTPTSYLPLMKHVGRTYYNKELKIFGLHGHQFDKSNHQATKGVGPLVGMKACNIEPKRPTNRIFRMLYKTIWPLRSRPFIPIDNVRPMHRLSKAFEAWVNQGLKKVPGWTVGLRAKIAAHVGKWLASKMFNYLLKDGDSDQIEHASALFKNGSTVDEGKNKITLPGGVEYVVMGHTHFPVNAGKYFNTGTWMGVLGLISNSTPPVTEWYEIWPYLVHYKNPQNNKVEKPVLMGMQYFPLKNKVKTSVLTPKMTNVFRKRFFGNETKTLDPNTNEVKSVP